MTYSGFQESYPSLSRKQTTNSKIHQSRTFGILHSFSLHSHFLKQVLTSLSDSPSLPLSPSMAQCSLCSIAWAPSTLPPARSSVALLLDAVDSVLSSFEFDTVYGSCLYKILFSFGSSDTIFCYFPWWLSGHLFLRSPLPLLNDPRYCCFSFFVL